MSSTPTTKHRRENPIPPWQRIAVSATTAAQMLDVSKSTFFERVRTGMYPKAGPDGRWSVAALRKLHEQSEDAAV